MAALAAAAEGATAAVARITEGPGELLGRAVLVHSDGTFEGTLGGHRELDRTAVVEAAALLDAGLTQTVTIGEDGSRCGRPLTLLVESSVPPPRMIVFGAIDFAAALVRVGKLLGYRVTVCDARPVFATATRFPEADEIVVDWPHRYLDSTEVDGRTALCVLTHDAKFDVPLLELALTLPVAYVGAMGSRRTHLDRNRRLREVGVTELELARLRSPIGLDLGARTPEETALSICAEIVAHRRGGTGVPLAGAHTPIHHDGNTTNRWTQGKEAKNPWTSLLRSSASPCPLLRSILSRGRNRHSDDANGGSEHRRQPGNNLRQYAGPDLLQKIQDTPCVPLCWRLLIKRTWQVFQRLIQADPKALYGVLGHRGRRAGQVP